ncbi:MAG: thiamine phosphate synthase [Intestinibacter sp.]|uniref:thiamine phosphate synthase n=1 Tax=Intestinibacter sp. TaxID=1965304 RepID=UPI002A83C228|nr:thiamine phosphate synthase [Intestinibacter sp.]MDY4575808.1 thiamine phosphate synthase [Intestinibacter sp.]
MKLDNEAIKKSMLLYAITDRAWLKEGETLEEVVEDVLKSGATFLQLREKIQGHEEIVEMAKKLQALCKKYNVPFVVNDDTMAAKEIDADGVHIGQSDMEYTKAREILGPDKIIGVSAGNLQEAKEAERVGADYIGVGAVFHTDTKKDATSLTMDQLKEICESVSIPVVAIGGISVDNALKLKGTGVDGICVISAIFGSENPSEATKKLLDLSKKIVSE